MNTYEVLAFWVDIIHYILIVIYGGGFFISPSRHPKIRQIHAALGITTLAIQLILSFRCPLTLVSRYLRDLAHPELANESFYYKPFIVEFLKNTFNFQVSDIIITIIMVLGTGVIIATLFNNKLFPKERLPMLKIR